jgi:cytosine/adenosine deaminase-related metal-dependent hydrolase
MAGPERDRRMIYRARAVLPITGPPLVPGWVEVDRGRIVRAGPGLEDPKGSDVEDLGDVAILPGLVNAHTHLELSWMAGRVPQAGSMVEWIRNLIQQRVSGPPGGDDEVVAAARRAAAAMRDTGTVLAGDISNTLMSPAVFAELGLSAAIFHEMLAFSAPDPAAIVDEAWQSIDRLSVAGEGHSANAPEFAFSVVAHAPYSVAPALFAEIARQRRSTPLSVHLGESPEEIAFLRTGGGPFRDLLEDLGAWTDAWTTPACDPVEYLARVGHLAPPILIVHAVHLDDPALERLRDVGAVVVTCPRSNVWVGAGLPRVAHFYGTGVPVAIGTDSLASTSTLNRFDELAELRRIAPDVSAASLLDSATRVGAEALGFGGEYGTLEPGRRAALVAVDLPGAVGDVEEYLVSGVPAHAVRRLPAG